MDAGVGILGLDGCPGCARSTGQGPGRSLRAVAHNRRTCLTPAGVIAERIKRLPNVGCQRRATASGDPDQTPLPGSEAVGQIIVDIDEEVGTIVCAVAAVPIGIIRCLSKLAKRQSWFERHQGSRSIRVFTDGELCATRSERWRGRAKDSGHAAGGVGAILVAGKPIIEPVVDNQTGTDIRRHGRCRTQRMDILDRCAERGYGCVVDDDVVKEEPVAVSGGSCCSGNTEHQCVYCIRSQRIRDWRAK